jgi:hypothetical protein
MSIFIRLSGGLGNQMFQYAFGHALAKRKKTNLIIDLDWFHNIPLGSSYQKERLTLLNCNLKFINSNGAINEIDGVKKNTLSAYFSKKKLVYKEKNNYIYDQKVINVKDGQYLDGYWQSYKYFTDCPELKEIFSPKKNLHKQTFDFLSQIKESQSVMLHVRRGDYVTSETANKFHGIQPIEYYKKAYELIRASVSNPQIYVFSDDIPWVKENLILDANLTFIENIDDSDNVIDELYLMSQCKHNIIANSSLSWWGAWLNNYEKKVVVAPKQWLAKNNPSLDDLIPANWVLL